MKAAFTSPEQVENFLCQNGVKFRKGYCPQPLKKLPVEFYQVKVGKSYYDVYDIVDWANVVYTRRSTQFLKNL